MNARNMIACAFVAALTMTATAPARATENQRQITVTGRGTVASVPDLATISLGVTSQAKEASVAMATTSAATAKMLQRLGDLGIEARDMQTSNLSLNPVWSDRSGSVPAAPKITGFVASNSVLVRVRELSDLGRIMDAVIADGANNFNGLQFSVQDPEPLLNKARQAAVADAMARAALLTAAAGVSLGPVLSMSEQGGGRPVMMEMSMARGNDVPIAAGEVSVSASVTMVFVIGE